MSELVGVDVVQYTRIGVSALMHKCTILPLDSANKMGVNTAGAESASAADAKHKLCRKE